MIADYFFPDVLTVFFKAESGIIGAKERVMYLLRTHLDENDLDSQSQAFTEIIKELKWVKSRRLIFNIYAAVMMLIIFIFSRISYELQIYLKGKRRLVSVVDIMRHNRLNASHTWMMLILPVALITAGYYAGHYLAFWQNLVSWWEFVIMAATALIGSLIIIMMLRVYEHDRILDNAPKAGEDSNA